MTPLDRLRARIPDLPPGQELMLMALLDDARDAILSYCNRTELPARMAHLQVSLALLYYNRQGIEGESAHSEGDVSRSIDSLPPDLLAQLNACRLLKVVTRQ